MDTEFTCLCECRAIRFCIDFMVLELPFLGGVMGVFDPFHGLILAASIFLFFAVLVLKQSPNQNDASMLKLQRLGNVHRK